MSRQALLLISTSLALAACGVAPSTGAAPSSAAPSPAAATLAPAAPATQGPTANPTPPGTGAPDPTAAVHALIFSPGAATACRPSGSGPRYSIAAGCPVTLRLEQRLESNPTAGTGEGADPICRCQNAADPPPVTVVSQAGVSAEVKVSFGFSGHPNDVRFTVVDLGGRWFVDDTYCGDPSTSIYQTPVTGCAA